MLKLRRWAFLVVLASAAAWPVAAQDRMNAFFIGHSLMSDLPGMTRSLVQGHARQTFNFRHQDIPGAPLRWQWDAKDRNESFEPQFGGRYHVHLPSGQYDTVVLTEGVPRGGKELEAETVDYLGRFVGYIRQQRPDARIFLYVTWPHLTSGTPKASPQDANLPTRHLKWRERIDADQPMWERMVAAVNQKHPGTNPVRIIDGGKVLAAIDDEIRAGRIPEWSSIEQLFRDDIHINHYGKYVVSLSFYAALTGKTPVGAPSDIKDAWGGSIWNRKVWDGNVYPPMRSETVRKVQEVVRSVVLP